MTEEGELIELFGPRDPGSRRMLWLHLLKHPSRRALIRRLRVKKQMLYLTAGNGGGAA